MTNRNGLRGKVVLILGGGEMQVELIKEGVRMGLEVVVMDSEAGAAGMGLGHYKLVASIGDIGAATAAAMRFHEEVKAIDGVLTVGTDFTLTVVHIGEKIGIGNRLSLEDARACTNKIVMRDRLGVHGVKQPRYRGVGTRGDWEELLSGLGKDLQFPLVIKPADSMGARGVKRVDTEGELRAEYLRSVRHSRSGEVIVEEYLPGEEFSVDALVYRGEIFVRGVARRLMGYAPYFVELGHYQPVREEIGDGIDDWEFKEIILSFKAGIRALGIKHGGAKGDIRLVDKRFLREHSYYSESERVYIGEIAGRLSGGFMSSYTTPYSSGVNLMRGILEIHLGEYPSGIVEKYHRWVMERGLFSENGQAGRIKRISGVLEAREFAGVREVFMRVKEGDIIKAPENNLMKCGNIICEAGSKAVLWERAERVLRKIKIEVE